MKAESLSLVMNVQRDCFEGQRKKNILGLRWLDLQGGVASDEIRFADKARDNIEALGPKSAQLIVTKNIQDTTARSNRYQMWGRSTRFAVKNRLASYTLRLTERKRESMEAVRPMTT